MRNPNYRRCQTPFSCPGRGHRHSLMTRWGLLWFYCTGGHAR